MTRRAWLAAAAVAAVAFALYRSTLLPGFDFGDTGSFQATVGSAHITPRDAYPLYFALGDLFVLLARTDPAHALNLVSAIEGTIACGLAVVVAAELSGSVAAGIAAALLFATSYTFWTQAIIAEVYALHVVFIASTLLLALRWQRAPTTGRLAAFFAVYALGFGNHLSMVLLLPAYAVFLLAAAPRGWRSMFAPRVVAIAAAFACLGALQYGWNLRTLWISEQPPHGIVDALGRFWFDVTKTDWRETMVLNVPRSMVVDHGLMYLFDLRQQFGPVIPAISALGLVRLARTDARRACLMVLLYAVNVLFAYTYNVGDTHVFYIPSHFVLALLAAPGLALVGDVVARLVSERASRTAPVAVGLVSAIAIGYAGVRGYRDYPAVDRSGDRRPTELMSSLTAGLDDRESIFLIELNWQLQNGLSYFAKVVRPELAVARLPDVLLYAPALLRDNAAIGREAALTANAGRELAGAYGPLVELEPDSRVRVTSIAELANGLPAGTRYVLSILKPAREYSIDAADLGATLRSLTGRTGAVPGGDYATVAGLAGETPALAVGANEPFARRVRLGGTDVQIRMESWLSADTIRRMGFGHIVASHHHTMILERGVNFVAFDDRGLPLRSGYAAGIFAPQPRFLVRLARGVRH